MKTPDSNWYIGQPVAALNTDREMKGGVVRGNEYKIQGLREPVCKCTTILIDVGVAFSPDPGKDRDLITCVTCRTSNIPMYGKRWYSSKWFAPLDVNISELTEILEREAVNV